MSLVAMLSATIAQLCDYRDLFQVLKEGRLPMRTGPGVKAFDSEVGRSIPHKASETPTGKDGKKKKRKEKCQLLNPRKLPSSVVE